MRKLSSVAVLGMLTAGLMLTMPSASQAQHHDHGGYGQFHGGYSGYNGYGNYGGYRGSYNWGYTPGYRSYFGPSYGYDSGYYGGRRAIVHPEHRHWTPDRGWHEHGHIHVPHRSHYHSYRY